MLPWESRVGTGPTKTYSVCYLDIVMMPDIALSLILTPLSLILKHTPTHGRPYRILLSTSGKARIPARADMPTNLPRDHSCLKLDAIVIYYHLDLRNAFWNVLCVDVVIWDVVESQGRGHTKALVLH